MARLTYSEAIQASTVDIKDKYLVIDTIQDGYFNIYKGLHPFRVVSEGEDLAVYPVYWSGDNKLTNEPYPIIRTVGEDVFFTKRTTNDPYNGPDLTTVQSNSQTTEHKVLDAFNVFAHDEFTLGYPNPIHVFIGDDEDVEVGVEDTPVEFEFRDLHGNVVDISQEEPEEPENPDQGEEEEEGNPGE